MQYMMIIYENAADFESRPQHMGAWFAYSKALVDAGVMAGGNGLQPPQTATTLKLKGGKRHVQDGPFADTKEQVGGYFIFEVPDLDTALDWAAKCPAASGAGVELRPVMVMPPQG